MHNKLEYARICKAGETELEELLDKHLGAILTRFRLDKTFWMNETSRWGSSSEEASEEWAAFLREQDEKQLDYIRNKSIRPKSFAMIRNVLEYKQK